MLRGHSPQQVGSVPRPCVSEETVVVEMTPLGLFGSAGSGLALSETTSETLAATFGGPSDGSDGGGVVSPTLLALCAASKARRPLASSVRSSTAPPTHAGAAMKKTVSFPRDEGQLNTMCPITPPTHANRFGQFGSLFPNQDFRGGRCQPEPFNLDDCALGADGSPSSQRSAAGVERRERGVSLGVLVLACFIVALYSMAVLADTPDGDVNPLAGTAAGGADGVDDATLVAAAAAAAAESRQAPSSSRRRTSATRGHRRRGTVEVTAEIRAECTSAGGETAETTSGQGLHRDGKSTDAVVRGDGGDAAAAPLGAGIGEMEAHRTIVCHTRGVLLDAGLRVTYRRATSPAALAGVRPGMRLTHVGGRAVSGVAEAATALRARHVDERVILVFSSAP